MTHQEIVVVVFSACMIPFTAIVLYFSLVAPERYLQKWAKKRGFVILMWDDEWIAERRTRYMPPLYKVRVRCADGTVKSGFVRLGDQFAYESWEGSLFTEIPL